MLIFFFLASVNSWLLYVNWMELVFFTVLYLNYMILYDQLNVYTRTHDTHARTHTRHTHTHKHTNVTNPMSRYLPATVLPIGLIVKKLTNR